MILNPLETIVMPDKIRKCPKCNKPASYYEEIWKNHCLQFDINGAKIDDEGYVGVGDPYKVKAVCDDCGYSWTVKGVTQISELRV